MMGNVSCKCFFPIHHTHLLLDHFDWISSSTPTLTLTSTLKFNLIKVCWKYFSHSYSPCSCCLRESISGCFYVLQGMATKWELAELADQRSNSVRYFYHHSSSSKSEQCFSLRCISSRFTGSDSAAGLVHWWLVGILDTIWWTRHGQGWEAVHCPPPPGPSSLPSPHLRQSGDALSNHFPHILSKHKKLI